MKKQILLIAAIGFGLAACTNEVLTPGDKEENIPGDKDNTSSNLTTIKLATFIGDQNRVSYEGRTRDGEVTTSKTLELIASIANPSKKEGFNFEKEDGGRFLSATSVYFDAENNKYYATYHMQGNNYNTNLNNEIGGAIQSFTIDEEGVVDLGLGFRAENPNKQDFDFNHLYFDVTDKRIVAVGHKWDVPSGWSEDEIYTGKRENTQAIIALFDPNTAELTVSPIYTGNKILDAAGKSLGDEGAGDANCVIRAGETNNRTQMGWDFYYVATRKGMAVLRAEADHLFEPVLVDDNTRYFIPTPGSAKFVAKTGTSSYFKLLYLAEDKDNEAYTSYSSAKIAQLSTNTGEGSTFGFLQTQHAPFTRYNLDIPIVEFDDQINIDEPISPIDGKNTVLANPGESNGYDDEVYAALGTGGMYYQFKGSNSNNEIKGTLKFKGSKNYLPVNCVYVDKSSLESGHDGFIYVACGARLVILHRATFEVAAYWNIPTKDEKGNEIDVEASANYIYVEKGPVNTDNSARERIITVAFGQEGVKVFRFNPSNLEKKTVWEKELPSEIICN